MYNLSITISQVKLIKLKTNENVVLLQGLKLYLLFSIVIQFSLLRKLFAILDLTLVNAVERRPLSVFAFNPSLSLICMFNFLQAFFNSICTYKAYELCRYD